MGKGRHGGGGHGGGGFHGGGGGFHHGGGGGGFHGGGGGMHHAGGGFHHGGPAGGFHHGGMGGPRMFHHGGPGYRGWWHGGGFGYWNGGWAGRGWFGRPCYGWFYPGWFYSWYGANLLFRGSPWFFGMPYYRPWYLPPQPTTTVVVINQQQSQPNTFVQQQNPSGYAYANASAPQSKDYVVAGATAASAPPAYSSAASSGPSSMSPPAFSSTAAPFGGEGEAEPALPPTYEASVKSTIEVAFDYAARHASVFWKFSDTYPFGFQEIDEYFRRFAVQQEIDLSAFPDSRISETIGFWDRVFCNSNSALLQRKQIVIQRIKTAYREYLLSHCAADGHFNAQFSNFEVAAHALYGCISKRYADAHPNDPVQFNFEELQQFVAMLEARFGTTELAIDANKSKKGELPFFVILQKS